MTKRHVVAVATHLVAAIVGGVLVGLMSLYYWRDSVRGFMSMSDLTVSGYYASLIDAQRDPAKPENYARALRDYLVVLDKLLVREPRSEVYSTLALDKTITLARLALFTEQREGVESAKSLFTQAVAQCKSFRTGDCSEESIRAWTAYIDKHGASLFGPPAK